MTRLEFELAYYVDAAQHMSLYATKTPPVEVIVSGKGKREEEVDENEEE